jgi:hypothetical protein
METLHFISNGEDPYPFIVLYLYGFQEQAAAAAAKMDASQVVLENCSDEVRAAHELAAAATADPS